MNTVSRVIFVTYLPMTEKFKKDFYITQIKQNGFVVEYWNLGLLFNNHIALSGEIDDDIVENIQSFKQLKEKIEACRQNALFVFNITYYGRVQKLFKVFSEYECLTAFFARGALPHPTANSSIFKKILAKYKALKNPRYIKETILNQSAIFSKKIGLIKPYNFIFYAGSNGVPNIGYGHQYGINKSKLIPVNSFDYDAFLSLQNIDCRQVPGSYCVFLDAYLPYHPDFKLLKLPQINADAYYTSLNNLFSFIEEKYNLRVIIAAHPKSYYDDKQSYKNRTIIKNKTAELVKYARFVITHVSTSLSFAILFKKPLLFTYTNDIRQTYNHTHYLMTLYFAELLKAPCINSDDDLKKTEILPVNEEAYNNYKYKYLTNPESESTLSEKIFINTLNALR